MKRHHGALDAPRPERTYYPLLAAAVSLTLVGCPQTLGDDFALGDGHANSANGGKSSRDTRIAHGGSAEGGTGVGDSSEVHSETGGTGTLVSGGEGGTGPASSGSSASAGTPTQGGTSSASTTACKIALGPPAPITFSDASISSTLGISGPSLSSDGLTLYFVVAQALSGLDQIYRATRATRETLVFSGATAVFASTTEARGTPALTSDDLTLYFYAVRWNGMGDRDLWFVKRSSVSSAFGELQAVTATNSSAVEHHPFLTQDQLALYYVSVQYSGGYYPTTTNSDIWRVTRTSTDQAFANPTEVEELNSPYRDQRITITSDGRVCYFASDRADYTQLDLWSATRTTQRGTFENPQVVMDEQVNSQSDEKDAALSPLEDELFFVSNRGGQEWIYRSTRGCQ